ncbi:SsgA family sporulation/cell division regulator [Saccharopolyspora spinosa]|uniref:Sporulation and cell division protein SsgA n=1 Tax=Saccharopolyspora spinosa TaxID=60894 RepID=E9KID0_SACSN|nr:SsgA family sporulation/cell division regulator [Saccharopolyspora spinosa]ADD31871.1 SsgA-like protein [Saccharopolyspora spinosa NRRL 18395]PKW17991.1 sporulation and cell division protein SsgA [Saccharopolyspora spinosa]
MTSQNHKTIRSNVVFDLTAPAGVRSPVWVELRYESREPYAVNMSFHAGMTGQIDWVIARDLLADGLIVASGEGDVQIIPQPDNHELVIIALSSPSGQAAFEAHAAELADFLDETYDVVAPGDEHKWMSIDEELSRLLQNDLH